MKSALGRKHPAADFAGRVIAQAGRGAGEVISMSPRARHWPPRLAAAAAVGVIAGSGLGYRQYRGAVAKEQVMAAFKIASVKVNHIQTHVREAAR